METLEANQDLKRVVVAHKIATISSAYSSIWWTGWAA